MPHIGRCPVENCQFFGHLTAHHVMPKRWHNQLRKEVDKDYLHHVEYLCRSCHDKLEVLIEGMERHAGRGERVKLDWIRYPYIYREFVIGRLY